MHVHATDGADFLGYDLAAGAFLDMQGYVEPEEVRRRVLAPDLDGFLERFVAERFALFWVRRFG